MIAPPALMEVEYLIACPICEGAFNGEAAYGNNMIATTENGEGVKMIYRRCGKCGVWALSPRMTDEYTKEYYGGQYRQERPIGISTCYTAKMRAMTQMKLVGHLMTGGAVLEIGCSNGYLLQEFYNRGFVGVGIDPDPDSAAVYRDIADVPRHPYDVIAMSHVLEHFNHPREILESLVKNQAETGTRLLVDVPNWPTCFEAGLYQPHHPFMFCQASLTRLLESVGCKVIHAVLHGDGSNESNNLLVVAEVL